MRKLVLAVVIAGLMPALLSAQVINTVGIARVASAPTHTPTAQGARVAIDTLSGDWYEWEPSSGTWREMGDRVQYTYTTGAPSFVPSKQRSRMALNAGDSLYVYQAGTWGLVGGAGPDLSSYLQFADTVALVATKSNLVDTATFLVSDTILIYRRNGLEIGRDTIRTRGSLTGSGTINYVSKFTAANVLGNSTIQDSSGLVGIGISPTPNVPVTIQGNFASASNPLQLQQTGLLLANNQDPGPFEANAIGLTYLFKNRGGGHVTTGYIRTLGYGVAGAGAFQGFMIQGSANNLTWTNLLGTTSSGVLTLPVSAGGEITYIGSGSSGVSGNTRHKFTLGGPVGGSTSGDALVGITGTYSTGSTLALSEAMLRINPTINSGSTGLYRGILIDPTLTAGPWRAIEARGETLLKGLGSTSATTALRVENSAGTDLLQIKDAGDLLINGAITAGYGGGGIATNLAFGNSSLGSNTGGSNNVAIGTAALLFNTIGLQNTAIGADAMRNSTNSNGSIAIGISSLRAGAASCVSIGNQSQEVNTGFANVSIGSTSLRHNVSGNRNTAIGADAMRYTEPGLNLTNISNSTFVGQNTRSNTDSIINAIVIGKDAIALGSNTTRIGNTSTAQTHLDGKLTIGTNTTPAASAIADFASTTQGFLPPRLTTAQRDAIASPAAGLILFCTDCTATDGSTGVSQTYSSSQWRNHY